MIHRRRKPTAQTTHDPPAGTRLLVIAARDAPSFDEVPQTVRALIAQADHVFVLAPTHAPQTLWPTLDHERARVAAARRLDRILGELRAAGIPATGAVGDDTPSTTVVDGMLRFAPHHVVVATRGAGWQERRLAEILEEEVDVPVTTFAPAGR